MLWLTPLDDWKATKKLTSRYPWMMGKTIINHWFLNFKVRQRSNLLPSEGKLRYLVGWALRTNIRRRSKRLRPFSRALVERDLVFTKRAHLRRMIYRSLHRVSRHQRVWPRKVALPKSRRSKFQSGTIAERMWTSPYSSKSLTTSQKRKKTNANVWFYCVLLYLGDLKKK